MHRSQAWDDLGPRDVDPEVSRKMHKLSYIEGVVGRDGLSRAFEILDREIPRGDEALATRRISQALGELAQLHYPLRPYEHLNSYALYLYFSRLRTEARELRPLTR